MLQLLAEERIGAPHRNAERQTRAAEDAAFGAAKGALRGPG